MRISVLLLMFLAAGCTKQVTKPETVSRAAAEKAVLDKIQHVVVIYAENRSFDNLYGEFPNADGVANASTKSKAQLDVSGAVLPELPPVWLDKGKEGLKPDPSYPEVIANQPFKINAFGTGHSLSDKTRDLVHRFYQNQEQINGGKNNQFAQISDAGGLTMGYYDGSSLPMWKLAQQYTLADHFFMGAYGGSFLNHMYLICACAPTFKNAPDNMRAKLGDQGYLLRKDSSSKSALQGAPQYVGDNPISPDGFAVNTTQPAYQPSGIAPESLQKIAFANPKAYPLPPQTIRTIGDALNEKNVSWAWYSGGWTMALVDGMQPAEKPRKVIYAGADGAPNFQPHHQPFNYFEKYAPGTPARLKHLRDENAFLQSIENGNLPAVSFYKPVGVYNEHPGYSDILTGDQHIADLVKKIQESPQWSSTVVIVTYDENGGFWDHVSPPKGDRWGPGTRIPTIIISPFAKKNFVDHTAYDTGSISKFITRRFNLTPLEGVRAHAGDLTNSLDINVAH